MAVENKNLSQVKFIRKNGRVIPIRQRKSGAVEGGLSVATGAAVALGAGHISGEMMHDSAHFENEARTRFKASSDKWKTFSKNPGLRKMNPKAYSLHRLNMRTARKGMKYSKTLFKFAYRTQLAGAAAAGGFIGHGVNKIYERVTGNEATRSQKAITFSASTVAGIGVSAAYLNRLSGGKMPQLLRGAISRFTRKAAGL